MAELLVNNASSNLSFTINNSVTTLTVASASSFPGTGNFRIRIENELMLVTGVSGNVFTVTRGVESTTAASHAAGSSVVHVLTAGGLAQFLLDNNATTPYLTGGYASRPAAGIAGRRYRATDADLEWLDTGTGWDLIHPIYVAAADAINTSSVWSWQSGTYNSGSNAFVNMNGVVNLTTGPGNGGDNSTFFYKTAPSTPYTLEGTMRHSMLQLTWHGLFIGTRNSSNGNIKTFFNLNNTAMSFDKYGGNGNSYSGGYSRTSCVFPNIFKYKLVDNGTNTSVYYSFDLYNWILYNTQTSTDFTGTADQVIFGILYDYGTYTHAGQFLSVKTY